jgi:cytochrome c-type biogenesis protein CcmH/NrfG
VRARHVAAVLVAVLVVYLGLAGYRGVLLLASGDPLQMLLGFGVLLLPVVGAYVVWREVQFGFATQRLARELGAAGRWPTEQLPTTPSGRPERDAADALFAVRRDEVAAAPDDWQAWFRLALAYEDARDRRRARAAMRRAIALHGRAR